MSKSLVLYENEDGPIIWRLDDLDEPTTVGIMSSLFYAMVDDPNKYNYALKAFNYGDDVRKLTYRDMVKLINEKGKTIDKLDAHIAHALADPRNRNLTTLTLRPLQGSDCYRTLFTREPERYLQGILTVVKHYGMNIDDIIFRGPCKDGQYYDVQ